jgi:hypothetical protein
MHELGFYESYLKERFSEEEWENFADFMFGQTCGDIDGESVYYFIDVQNFCSRFGVNYPYLYEDSNYYDSDYYGLDELYFDRK